MKFKTRYSLLLCLTMLLTSCMCIYDYRCCLCDYKTNKISYRDSVAFDYGIRYIINYDLNKFLHWKEKCEHPLFSIYFIDIQQSPDSLKSVILMAARLPKEVDPKNKNYSFLGNIIYGIRNSKEDLWELYPSLFYGPIGWDTKEEILCLLENYLHKRIKKDAFLIANPKLKKEDILNYYKHSDTTFLLAHNHYTVDDPEFWTESIYFKKDLRAKGYYMFQTYTHIPLDDQIIKYSIEYPDSILKMYGKTKSGSK